MFAVVYCVKYNQRTLRVADVGDSTLDEAKERFANSQAMECPICGPCSHVELSWRGYLKIHGMLHENLEQAIASARILNSSNPGRYRLEVPQETT